MFQSDRPVLLYNAEVQVPSLEAMDRFSGLQVKRTSVSRMTARPVMSFAGLFWWVQRVVPSNGSNRLT